MNIVLNIQSTGGYTRNPFPCNNYDSSYHDQPLQYQPEPLPQNLLLDLLDLVKDLKECKHSQDNPNEKSMEVLLAEERAAKLDSQIAFEKSIKESIAKENQ